MTTKVIVFSSPPNQDYLEFRLIFCDGYEKHYKLSMDEIQCYRSASERDIIQHMAEEYYMLNQIPVENHRLIFY